MAAIDDLSTGSRSNIAHLLGHLRFRFVHADINDRLVMERVASEAAIIVHLAAAVGVKLIIDRPVHTIETNIMGTDAVLSAAFRYGCRVLIASTSEVYGKGIRVPFREDDDVVLGSTARHRWAYAANPQTRRNDSDNRWLAVRDQARSVRRSFRSRVRGYAAPRPRHRTHPSPSRLGTAYSAGKDTRGRARLPAFGARLMRGAFSRHSELS